MSAGDPGSPGKPVPVPTVVITGVGLLSSLGTSVEVHADGVLAGKSGLTKLEGEPLGGHFCQAGGVASPFDLASRLRQPKSVKFMSRSIMLAVYAALDAVKSSGLSSPVANPDRVALYVGSGQTGLEIDEFFKALSLAWTDGTDCDWSKLDTRAAKMIDRYFSLRTLSNAGLALVSSEFGIQGPSANYVQSETASANALENAYWDLLEERCDQAMAGGYESLLLPAILMGYGDEGLLTRRAAPDAYRPFDASRDGIALGEGAGFIVMEREDTATARGAEILGEIVGIYTATGCEVVGPETGQRESLESVLRMALAKAGKPDFVVARGFGTLAADTLEAEILAAELPAGTPVTALKGHTGYLGAATAITELAMGLGFAARGIVPPIANLTTPERTDLRLVMGTPVPLTAERPLGFFISFSHSGQTTIIAAAGRRK